MRREETFSSECSPSLPLGPTTPPTHETSISSLALRCALSLAHPSFLRPHSPRPPLCLVVCPTSLQSSPRWRCLRCRRHERRGWAGAGGRAFGRRQPAERMLRREAVRRRWWVRRGTRPHVTLGTREGRPRLPPFPCREYDASLPKSGVVSCLFVLPSALANVTFRPSFALFNCTGAPESPFRLGKLEALRLRPQNQKEGERTPAALPFQVAVRD